MIPFIIGGVALAATGYGLKKYLDNNNKTIEDVAIDFFEWRDNLGRKIEEVGDSIVYRDEKEDNTPKDVIEEFNIIHTGFYERTIPLFLEVYGGIKNLLYLDMESYYELETKVKTNIFDISDEPKIELDNYLIKFSKGICTVLTKLKEIETLQKSNHDFNLFSKNIRKKIENTHSLTAKIIDIM